MSHNNLASPHQANFIPTMRYRSPKQTAASRANGAHSLGPTTPPDQRKPSQNSRSLGIFAKAILLPGESRTEFDRLATQLHDRFQPADYLETMIVQRMLLAQWRLIRVWAFEQAGMVEQRLPGPTLMPVDPAADPATRDFVAFQNLHARARSGSVLQVSELRYQRQFDDAVVQLERLRAMHHKESGKRTR